MHVFLVLKLILISHHALLTQFILNSSDRPLDLQKNLIKVPYLFNF